MDPLDRFMSKTEKTKDCWLFNGSKSNGYGQFWIGKKKFLAHRWIYERLIGEIPHGLQIDHLCRNRGCVNPDHLEVVTNQEQQRRKSESQTHCKHGHEFTKENTYLYNNKRNCRACGRRRGLINYYMHRGNK